MTESVQQQLGRMITGYWTSQAIYAAAKFGIADLLEGGPRSVEDLATASSTDPGALYRLLRALASIEIFVETAPRTFALTPLAQALQSDTPGSARALALMSGGEQFRAWADIAYSIQTGRTAFEHVLGQPLFEYLSENPQQARIFDGAMTGIHGRETADVLEAYDFSDVRLLADIGGGNGLNLTTILQQHPQMNGVLFDLPHVIEAARPQIQQTGLADRCQLVGGSFFEQIPPGADVYFLRHIIHDWDDEKSQAILANCHRAMPADGRLLIVESVIPPGNEPFAGKFLDLVMLLIPGGKERTREEYEALFGQAGFELKRVIPTRSELSILEATKR